MILRYGTELKLPELPKVFKWEDIYLFWDGFMVDEDGVSESTSGFPNVFATEQQAESVQAAAMISQTREQGKDVYGEIVPIHTWAWVLRFHRDTDEIVTDDNYMINGGLLRFETRNQAQLFLDNNRELVTEYLKTF